MVLSGLYSCNATDFSGSGARKNASSGSPSGAEPGPVNKIGTSTQSPVPEDSGPSPSPGTGINQQCLAKKAREYNIVVVVDASLSERFNDPRNLRGEAVARLANDLSSFTKKNPGSSVKMALIGFAREAQLGANGIVNLTKDTPLKVTQDANSLNQMGGLGTNFDAALAATQTTLKNMGAKGNQPDQRNFVVFISDGEPNRGDSGPSLNANTLLGNINQYVANIVSTYDAAFITIATGSDINQNGIDIINAMAKPSDKPAHPDHKGQFFRIQDDDGLSRLDNQIGKAISGC